MSSGSTTDPPPDAKRVLAVTIGGLGDAVLFSPVFKALRARYPAAHVELLLASPLAAEAYAGAAELDRLVVVRTNRATSVLRAAALVSFAWRARAQSGFDLAVYATGLKRAFSRFLALSAGIRHTMHAPLAPAHATDLACNTALARRFDADLSEAAAYVPVTAAAEAETAALLDRHGLSAAAAGLVAVYPSTDIRHRPRWPLDHLVAVLGRVKARHTGIKVVVVGSAEEGGEWQAADTAGVADANLAGRLSIPALAALFGRCRLAVCNDGGLMHVAGAAGCPVTSVMPNAPASYRPPGRANVLVCATLACRVHYPNRPAWCRDPECTRSVSPEAVYAACEQQLSIPTATGART
ncbi:MAG: glycosyltransferase family 9 protein [Kiritimatiellae bacterium]|nr:glycosyltransferase family 9 protein [Kiritimatiellia bacterium]